MEIGSVSLTDQLKMLRGVEPIRTDANQTAETGEAGNKPTFADFLVKSFDEANQQGLDLDRRIQETIEGKSANPHETLIAMQKADVSFRLMQTVKEQLEQAVQQILRTSIG